MMTSCVDLLRNLEIETNRLYQYEARINSTIQHLENELKSKENQQKNLEIKRQDDQADFQSFRNDSESAVKELQKSKDEFEGVDKNLDLTNLEIESMSERLAQLKQDCTALADAKEKAIIEKNHVKNEAEEYEAKVKSMLEIASKECAQVETEFETHQRDVEQSRNSLKKQILTCATQLSEVNAVNESHNVAIAEKYQIGKEVQACVDSLKETLTEKNEALEIEMADTSEQEYTAVHSQVEADQDKLDCLEKTIKELKSEVEETDREISYLSHHAMGLVVNWNRKLESIQLDNKLAESLHLGGVLEKQIQDLNEMAAQVESLEAEINRANMQKPELEEKIRKQCEKEQELEQLVREEQQLKKDMESLEEQHALQLASDETLKVIQEKINSRQNGLTVSQGKRNAQQENLQKLREQLKQIDDDNKAHDAQFNELKNKDHDMASQLESGDKLKEDIVEESGKLEQLKKEMATLKDEMAQKETEKRNQEAEDAKQEQALIAKNKKIDDVHNELYKKLRSLVAEKNDLESKKAEQKKQASVSAPPPKTPKANPPILKSLEKSNLESKKAEQKKQASISAAPPKTPKANPPVLKSLEMEKSQLASKPVEKKQTCYSDAYPMTPRANPPSTPKTNPPPMAGLDKTNPSAVSRFTLDPSVLKKTPQPPTTTKSVNKFFKSGRTPGGSGTKRVSFLDDDMKVGGKRSGSSSTTPKTYKKARKSDPSPTKPISPYKSKRLAANNAKFLFNVRGIDVYDDSD